MHLIGWTAQKRDWPSAFDRQQPNVIARLLGRNRISNALRVGGPIRGDGVDASRMKPMLRLLIQEKRTFASAGSALLKQFHQAVPAAPEHEPRAIWRPYRSGIHQCR